MQATNRHKQIADIRSRLEAILKQHPLPWSGISASRIRDKNRMVIVSAEDCTDTEADFMRESAGDILSLLNLLDTFQDMRPEEFKALWQAKCLKSGIHHGYENLPGRVDVPVFNQLRNHGWIEPNPDRAGFWILTEAGRLLIGYVSRFV